MHVCSDVRDICVKSETVHAMYLPCGARVFLRLTSTHKVSKKQKKIEMMLSLRALKALKQA